VTTLQLVLCGGTVLAGLCQLVLLLLLMAGAPQQQQQEV
jgi:hypothetical protein